MDTNPSDLSWAGKAVQPPRRYAPPLLKKEGERENLPLFMAYILVRYPSRFG